MAWRTNALFCHKGYCSETVSHRPHSKPVHHLHVVLNDKEGIFLVLENFLVRKLYLKFLKWAKNFHVYADPYRGPHSMWHLSTSLTV